MSLQIATPEDFLRSLDATKVERRKRKLTVQQTGERRLAPWERYRALTDHYDTLQDLSEQSDRKARFALVILGSLNAVNLLLAARGDMFGLPHIDAMFATAYVGSYVMLSLGLFFYAIAALRPRPIAGDAGDDSAASWLRCDSTRTQATLAEYRERWRAIELSQLTDELATVSYLTARMNATRTRALQRVYVGLGGLVLLTGVLLVALMTSAVR